MGVDNFCLLGPKALVVCPLMNFPAAFMVFLSHPSDSVSRILPFMIFNLPFLTDGLIVISKVSPDGTIGNVLTVIYSHFYLCTVYFFSVREISFPLGSGPSS